VAVVFKLALAPCIERFTFRLFPTVDTSSRRDFAERKNSITVSWICRGQEESTHPGDSVRA